jgi:predicted nuclease of predicted toxin-antitoxin system
MGRFKIDENLPREAADVLREAGHDAMSVMDQQLGGRQDPDIAAVCRAEDRTLVTLNLDFADIRAYPPSEYAGIIVLRLARLDKRSVIAVLQRLTRLVDEVPLTARLWIVGARGNRTRRFQTPVRRNCREK